MKGTLKKALKTVVGAVLRPFNIAITSHSRLAYLVASDGENSSAAVDMKLLRALPVEQTPLILPLLAKSTAQIRQDLFVLATLDFKRSGYFVEFGAASGVDVSNTHLLEKEFGWNGILAEPARVWHEKLKRSRNAHIETKCVWKTSGSMLTFNEARQPELSTIASFSSTDPQSAARARGNSYEVETISLLDLLRKYDAPRVIDYLSMDTEGSEFEILEHFAFDEYRFSVITVEHNFTPMRDKLFSLLSRHGYVRVLEGLSNFDDWYVGQRS